MSSSSQNWKNAEGQFAEELKKFGIPAKRKTERSGNYAISDYDVEVEGSPWFIGDSKYSKSSPFRHHSKYREIKSRYCDSPRDIAVLYTKNYKEHFGLISIDIRFFAALLSLWLGLNTREQAEEILFGQ